jgi:hypothetical protein
MDYEKTLGVFETPVFLPFLFGEHVYNPTGEAP